MHLIAGLLRPDRGEVRINQTVWFSSAENIDVPTRRRGVGFVFQEYALFPHLSVVDNIAFAQNSRHKGDGTGHATQTTLQELMAEFELTGLAQAFAGQLSGGKRQPVALARALAARPRLLLDEPFAALDAPLRGRLRAELLAVRAHFGVPTIVITHDLEDVAALGGHAIHIQQGRIVA